MRGIFGWSLPPGVSHRMIDDLSIEGPCAVCANSVDNCICPVCPHCEAVGDLRCYDGGFPDGMLHGLKRNEEQIASFMSAERERAVQDEMEARYPDD